MRTRLVTAATLAVAIFGFSAGPSHAQVTKSGAGYQFRMKFTKGQTVKYKITNSVPMPNQPQPFTMVMPVVQTTTDVVKGVASITGKVGPISMNGKPMSQEPVTSTSKLNNLGKPVGGGPNTNSTFTTYPEKPVKVGDTWTSTVPMGGAGTPGGTAQATYKFLGLKTVNGKQVADVSLVLKADGAQGKADGTGRGLILVSDGLPLKMDIKLNMTNPQAPNQKMAATISVIRV